MFEVDLLTVDFDLESILQYLVEMPSSVDPPTDELDHELISRFRVGMLRKLFDFDPGLFYDFKLKCQRKLKLDR